jgi:transmembrane sensor
MSPRPIDRTADGEREAARIADEAAAWVARCDRGLTAAERADYETWKEADPRHAAELAHFGGAWDELAGLAELPELAAEARALDEETARALRRKRFVWRLGGLAAAAAVALMFALPALRREAPGPEASVAGTFVEIPGSAHNQALPDGTVVQLNGDSRIEAGFTEDRRRVRLLQGEALFTVVPDPARPFVVDVDGVEVRAVGTAFNVRRNAAGVEVLVTEGRIQIEGGMDGAAVEPTPVTAGHRAIVDRPRAAGAAVSVAVAVAAVTAVETADALSWQGARLIFDRLPLPEAVEAFNAHNRVRLSLDDPSLANRRISGSFRADNLDGFVRLVCETFDLQSEAHDGDLIVLRPAR